MATEQQLLLLKAQKLQAAKKALTEGTNNLNQQREQQLPTYTEDANAADARAAQEIQQARERMAANGSYRSGTMNSDEATLRSAADTQIGKIRLAKEQYLNSYNSKLGQLNQDYIDTEKNTEDEYSANVAALKDAGAQQRAAALSRATATTKTAQKKQANADAQDWIKQMVGYGYTVDEINRAIDANKEIFANAGVSTSQMKDDVYTMWEGNRFRAGGYVPR